MFLIRLFPACWQKYLRHLVHGCTRLVCAGGEVKHLTVEEGNICGWELRSDWQAQEVIDAGDVILKQDAKQLVSLHTMIKKKHFFRNQSQTFSYRLHVFAVAHCWIMQSITMATAGPQKTRFRLPKQQQWSQEDPRGEKWDTSPCRTIRLQSKYEWKWLQVELDFFLCIFHAV